MAEDLKLGLRLTFNGDAFDRGLKRSLKAQQTFTQGIKDDLRHLNQAFNGFSAVTKIAGAVGANYGLKSLITQSAELDRSLVKIKHTAGMTSTEMATARQQIWEMSKQTGVDMNDLKTGLDSAVQSGLSFKEALPVIGAVNNAVAATGANANALTGGLTVAAEAFSFDLSKPQMAIDLLDKMAVAAVKGNAELGNLSDIFARVGVNANSAGLSYEKTLALIEALSLAEKNPERLSTLTDSTLRLFTNQNYMKDAQKATGIKFFDAKGSRREATDVLTDIKKKYDTLKTDAQRFKFISAAFGKADQDTIKGLKMLLDNDALNKVKDFSKDIEQASGKIAKDLPESINNTIDQAGRLKNVLLEAADEFAQPINKVLTMGMKKFADTKEQGGWDPSAGAVIAGGLGALAAGRLAYKRVSGGGADKLIEKMTQGSHQGLQKVFVTNWPNKLMTSSESLSKADGQTSKGDAEKTTDKAKKAGRFGGIVKAVKANALISGGLAAYDAYGVYSNDQLSSEQKQQEYSGIAGGAAGGATGALVGGAIGSLFGGVGAIPGALIGGAIGNMLGEAAGEELTKKMQATPQEQTKVGGELRIKVEGPAKVEGLRTNNPNVPINVDSGVMMMDTL